MPTPGSTVIQQSIGTIPIPFGTFVDVSVLNSGEFITRLSIGMDAGWGSLYPTTSSTCITTIPDAFSGYVADGASSLCWLAALGKGIDDEMTEWVSSWNGSNHSYSPTEESIFDAIIAEIVICGYTNTHTNPVMEKIAEVWMASFGQEAG